MILPTLLISLALSLVISVVHVQALPKSDLFPYGKEQYLPAQDDVSSAEFPLSIPYVFYGTEYRSIYVNENGLISFLTEVPSFFNAQFPLTYPIIAPLYSDVDTREAGKIYYRETQSQELLDRATRDIRNHFSNAASFQARSLFIVTWDGVGHYERSTDKVNTFQVVLVTDGDSTYAYFLYPENGVQWIRSDGKNRNLPDARAQAGFMPGDGRLYTLRGSGTEQARNFDRMSNVRTPGVWMFYLGRSGYNEGNVLPADLETGGQETLESGGTASSGSCATTLLPCPPQSICVDKPDQRGFCCECQEQYMGNGRNCVEKNSTQRMNGKVNGVINGVPLEDADLHAYIVTNAGRTYTAVSRVPSAVGSDLQVLLPLGGVVGWLFAMSRSSAPNGFTITGGAFNRTVEVDFPQSGDHVYIEETFLGPDVFNYMRVEVKLRGTVPSVPLGAKIEVDDYEEEYTRVSPGTIRSHASRSYRLEGNSLEVPFTLDQTITYSECEEPMTNIRLKVARNFIVYDAQEQIVRYAMTNKVSPLAAGDPCKEGKHECGPNSQCIVEGDGFRCACAQGYQLFYEQDTTREHPSCIDMNECNLGRHNCHVFADCINLPGSFACRCHSGYVGDGTNCERKTTCAELTCDINADCSEWGPLRIPRCSCRQGFIGDGFQCQPADTDDCRQTNYCDRRAECVFNDAGQRYECRCRSGYTGDGIVCVEDSCDVANNCSPQGECLYDNEGGTYYCACKPGYSGDGYVCLREDAYLSCNVVNNCHPLAQCVYDSSQDRHLCRCNAGYTGDGQTCTRHDEASCDRVAICSNYATCVLDRFTNRHVCICRDGYEGDGITCTPIDECNTVDNCDVNAQCVYDPSAQRYRCQCSPGYYGNGKECQPDESATCNVRNNCDEHATCIYDSVNLIYRCQCQAGYEGDGLRCEKSTAGTPCNVINTCHVRAECVYDPQAGGYRCRCQNGYAGDGHVCKPIRSCREDRYLCDTNADCVVHDSSGEYVCHCRQGYVGDGIACTPSPQHSGGNLVFAQGMSLLKIPTTPSRNDPGSLLLMEPHQTPIGIAADCQQGHLYWADVSLRNIRRANYNGSEVTVVLAKDMVSPEGVAVDWLARNIYWTDSAKDTVEVASLSNSYKKVLVSENLDNPRGIAIHPGIGKLYWSDWSRNSPKIEVSNMDGSNRADFVASNLGLPNMLVIDYERNNLCWTDAGLGRIECISVNGQSRRLIYTPAAYPFGIAIHEGYLYWTDWEIKFVHRVNINGGDAEPLEVPAGGSGRMYGIVSLPSYCPAVSSPCAVDNGGCRYLCLPDGRGGRSCICPDAQEDETGPIECGEVL